MLIRSSLIRSDLPRAAGNDARERKRRLRIGREILAEPGGTRDRPKCAAGRNRRRSLRHRGRFRSGQSVGAIFLGAIGLGEAILAGVVKIERGACRIELRLGAVALRLRDVLDGLRFCLVDLGAFALQGHLDRKSTL